MRNDSRPEFTTCRSAGRVEPRVLPRAIRAWTALVAAALCVGQTHAQGLVVRPVPGVAIGTINRLLGTETLDALDSAPVYLIDLPGQVPPHVPALLLEALQNSPLVDWAEPNVPMRTMEGTTGSFFVSAVAPAYMEQYAVSRINLDLAAPERDGGAEVLVAVLDTGIDAEHPVLQERVRLDLARNFVDPRSDTADVGNDADDDGDGIVDELVGHGTHVAGLVHLVAPSALLVPIKVLDSDGVGSSFRVAQGIHHAVESGAAVINLSMTSSAESKVLGEAIERAVAAEVMIVAATGNGNVAERLYPAAAPGVVGVAATDADDLKSGFSNYGEHVDMSAPGSGVVSTMPGGAYGSGDGTSLAAGLVSGALALLRAQPGVADAATIETTLTASASDLDALNPRYANLLGAGRVDVGAALDPIDAATAVVPGDANADGLVDDDDLRAVLRDWGSCPSDRCPADLTGDRFVDEDDLRVVIEH
ncbi:MAG: S8 family serine peptidase [Planctomycetota bacterium]|jgi:hypothetical protein